MGLIRHIMGQNARTIGQGGDIANWLPPTDPGVFGGGGGGGMRAPQTPPITMQPPATGGMGGGMQGFGAAPSGGFLQAFSQNPQFQQQLQAMMSGQSPGFGPVQFNPMVRG